VIGKDFENLETIIGDDEIPHFIFLSLKPDNYSITKQNKRHAENKTQQDCKKQVTTIR